MLKERTLINKNSIDIYINSAACCLIQMREQLKNKILTIGQDLTDQSPEQALAQYH